MFIIKALLASALLLPSSHWARFCDPAKPRAIYQCLLVQDGQVVMAADWPSHADSAAEALLDCYKVHTVDPETEAYYQRRYPGFIYGTRLVYVCPCGDERE